MELIESYLELVADRPPFFNTLDLSGVQDRWRCIFESEEKFISVYAGRRTGKSHHIGLRAIHSEYNCIIIVPVWHHVQYTMQLLEELSEGMDINLIQSDRNTYSGIIQYNNGRYIRVISSGAGYRGFEFMGHEIFIDEFDMGTSSLGSLLAANYRCLLDAHRVIAVSSLYRLEMTRGKRWFASSGAKFIIDTPSVREEDINGNRHQFFPSEYRRLLESIQPDNRIA